MRRTLLRFGVRFGFLLGMVGGLGAACDRPTEGPKKSNAEREAESYAAATTPTLDSYQEVFERLAEHVSDDSYEHLACPTELTQQLENDIWLNASTLALTESALRWFAEAPRTKVPSPELSPTWSQGAEGYLNDFGLAAPDLSGLDGGRVAFLRDARLYEQHARTDMRTPGQLRNRFIHLFDAEHRKAPTHVLLLRSMKLVEPKAPDQIARTKDELLMDQLGRDLATKKAPDLAAALAEPPAHSETSFVGGQLRGVLEVYDASTGKRLCGHAIDAKNSEKIKSYYSGARAVHDDLSDNLVTAANAAFSTPLRKVHVPT